VTGKGRASAHTRRPTGYPARGRETRRQTLSQQFGDAKAEEAISRQVANVEAARDELDSIRLEQQNPVLERADEADLEERFGFASKTLDNAQDKLDRLLGINPDTIKERRKRDEYREAERQTMGGWRPPEADPSLSPPAPRRLFPASGNTSEQEPRKGDTRTDVERLADVLGWTREKVYRNLRRMPGAHKRNPGATTNKSWWEIPDPEESARQWRAGVRKPQPE
jgi:hypothetical protein